MFVFSFMNDQGEARLGAMPQYREEIREAVDITSVFPTLVALVEAGPSGAAQVEELMREPSARERIAPEQLMAPIPSPRRNVFCVGWNYLKHFNEGAALREPDVELPEYPNFFTKGTLSVIGPNASVPLHQTVTSKLDYEAEVAVIVGRRGVNIPENEAMDYVWGYTLANDVSARDLQRRHGGQWLKGKALDGACPMGPGVVTADEIGDPAELDIRCLINGDKRQEAILRQLIFPVARLIHELSQGMTLIPGDILLTGTPDGIGNALKPPVFLKDGDVMTVESSRLGKLVNRVTA